MARLDTISISFEGKDFSVAKIPNIFSDCNQRILIGPHSLNEALYNNDRGYVNGIACRIDEQIYAYLDDEFFSLSSERFLEKVKLYLD